MSVGHRIVSDEPRTLYPGDLLEGALAAQMIAQGLAEEISEPTADLEATHEESKPEVVLAKPKGRPKKKKA